MQSISIQNGIWFHHSNAKIYFFFNEAVCWQDKLLITSKGQSNCQPTLYLYIYERTQTSFSHAPFLRKQLEDFFSRLKKKTKEIHRMLSSTSLVVTQPHEIIRWRTNKGGKLLKGKPPRRKEKGGDNEEKGGGEQTKMTYLIILGIFKVRWEN